MRKIDIAILSGFAGMFIGFFIGVLETKKYYERTIDISKSKQDEPTFTNTTQPVHVVKHCDIKPPTKNEEPVIETPSVPVIESKAEVISEDDYGDGNLDYLCCEYLFYDSDGVVCDEADNPVDQDEIFPGIDIRKQFETTDPDTIYIRNHSRHTDYCIIRDYGSYENDIAPYKPPDICAKFMDEEDNFPEED